MKHNIFSLFILFFLPFNLTSMSAFPSVYESGYSTPSIPVLEFFGNQASQEVQDATRRELVLRELLPNSQNTLQQTTEPTYSEKYSIPAEYAMRIIADNGKFYSRTAVEEQSLIQQDIPDGFNPITGVVTVDEYDFSLPSNSILLDKDLIRASDGSIAVYNRETKTLETKISSSFRVVDACIDGDGTVWGVSTSTLALVNDKGESFPLEGSENLYFSISADSTSVLISNTGLQETRFYAFNLNSKTFVTLPARPHVNNVKIGTKDVFTHNGNFYICSTILKDGGEFQGTKIFQTNESGEPWKEIWYKALPSTDADEYAQDMAGLIDEAGNIHFGMVFNQYENAKIIIVSPNLAPSPEFAIGDQSLRAGVAQKITLPTFSDPENTPVSYVVEANADWIVYNPADHSITATAPASAIDGTFSVTITATDADGISAGLKFDITVSENLAPEAPAIADQSATAGIAYNFEIPTATDPEGDAPISISAIGLPSGLSVVNGSIQGTATESGTFAVTVMYIDAYGAYSETSFTLSVAENIAPEVPDFSVPNWYQGRADSTYTFPEGTDAEAQTLSYTLTGTLPEGLSFDANTRTLSGTATQSGSFPLVYEVSDGYNTTEVAFTLVVEPNTGVGEMVEPEIVVYPNPATDKVFINGIKATSDVRIQLHDVMGRTLQITYQRNGETIEISFSEIPAGTYFLSIREGSVVRTIDIQKK